MTWTEQKQKGTNFKVQGIAIANPLYIDLIHHCTKSGECEGEDKSEGYVSAVIECTVQCRGRVQCTKGFYSMKYQTILLKTFIVEHIVQGRM